MFSQENKLPAFTLSNAAKTKLQQYNFPGNIRELKAIIDLACVMCDNQIITDTDITINSVSQQQTFTNMEKSLREYNADIITFYLKKYNSNVVEVAKRLDIGKSSIYNMIKNKEIVLP